MIAGIGVEIVDVSRVEKLVLAEARHAQELLGKGGVIGKIVLVPNGSSPESGTGSQ